MNATAHSNLNMKKDRKKKRVLTNVRFPLTFLSPIAVPDHFPSPLKSQCGTNDIHLLCIMHILYRIHISCLHTRWSTQGLIPEDRPQQRVVYYALLTQAMEQLLVCAVVCICVHVQFFLCVCVCILCMLIGNLCYSPKISRVRVCIFVYPSSIHTHLSQYIQLRCHAWGKMLCFQTEYLCFYHSCMLYCCVLSFVWQSCLKDQSGNLHDRWSLFLYEVCHA